MQEDIEDDGWRQIDIIFHDDDQALFKQALEDRFEHFQIVSDRANAMRKVKQLTDFAPGPDTSRLVFVPRDQLTLETVRKRCGIYWHCFWFPREHPLERWQSPTLYDHHLAVSFTSGDEEGNRLADKLFGIVKSLSSNRLDRWNPRRLKPTGRQVRTIWAGWHAIRWCLEAEDRLLNGKYRPDAEAARLSEAFLRRAGPGSRP